MFARLRLLLLLQDPWIQNATLRNNVLMGHSFEQGSYERAIHASCLGQDLEVRVQGCMRVHMKILPLHICHSAFLFSPFTADRL